MDEFLKKVSELCWEYEVEILPNTNKTLKVVDEDGNEVELVCIDGDGVIGCELKKYLISRAKEMNLLKYFPKNFEI